MTETNTNILCNKRRYKYITPFFVHMHCQGVDYVMPTNATSFGQGCKKYCIFFYIRVWVVRGNFFFAYDNPTQNGGQAYRWGVQMQCISLFLKFTYSFLSFHKELYHLVLSVRFWKNRNRNLISSNKYVAYFFLI